MAGTAAVRLHIKADGVERLQARCVDERLLRKPLRKLMRAAGNYVKKAYVARARPISRRTARRVRVKITQGKGPAFIPESVHVMSRYPGAPSIVSGRRPGAKMPPIVAIRGGYPAAQAVKRTGMAARPFVEAVFSETRGAVEKLLKDGAAEIERTWRA